MQSRDILSLARYPVPVWELLYLPQKLSRVQGSDPNLECSEVLTFFHTGLCMVGASSSTDMELRKPERSINPSRARRLADFPYLPRAHDAAFDSCSSYRMAGSLKFFFRPFLDARLAELWSGVSMALSLVIFFLFSHTHTLSHSLSCCIYIYIYVRPDVFHGISE